MPPTSVGKGLWDAGALRSAVFVFPLPAAEKAAALSGARPLLGHGGAARVTQQRRVMMSVEKLLVC